MNASIDLYAHIYPNQFGPRITRLGGDSAELTFTLYLDKDMRTTVFLNHAQMTELRDVLSKAIEENPVTVAEAVA